MDEGMQGGFWREIETAPYNERIQLNTVSESGHYKIEIGYFDKNKGIFIGRDGRIIDPLYWRPLPKQLTGIRPRLIIIGVLIIVISRYFYATLGS